MSLEGYSSQARDAFYACVEREAKKKPTEIASVGLLFPAECKMCREEYVNSCRPTWVKHFDREYCGKKRCRRLLDDNETRRGRLTLPQSIKPRSSCSSELS
ncbi:Cytochrome c oxidase [Perilla frutescens var. hirtella]|uniref:Cytochrome c oxidase n=1 Tax=Perilla frutescens var. hirtella TaxID=608512 RepID=A0AAD4J7V3_PERFH|nr:Cytochrome c oxidase [Perilla frutescens var. hirtella]